MKIVLIGSSGTIGRAVSQALAARHQIIAVRHQTGPHRVDLADPASIQRLLAEIGPFDAVVCAAGLAAFGPLEKLTDADFRRCLENKLMGQVHVARAAISTLADHGSITLTSGVLGRFPTPGSSAAAMVNGALESFVRAAALEMPRSLRINAVSPGWVLETLHAYGMDPAGGIPAAEVARAYVESVEGTASGAILETPVVR